MSMVKKKGYMYLDLGRALVNYDPLFTIKREKIQNFLNLTLSLSLSLSREKSPFYHDLEIQNHTQKGKKEVKASCWVALLK